MRTNVIKYFMLPVLIFLFISACKKDDNGPQGTLKIGITDTRSTQKSDKSIIDASKLSKFEITISKIDLKTSSGAKINVLNQSVTVDLVNYRGTVKDLISSSIPLGTYSGFIITLSGITVSYDGNTYSSSTNGNASLILEDLPGTTFTTAQGIPDIFSSEIAVDASIQFELTEELNNRNLNITLDAVAWCTEMQFTCAVCTEHTQYFVALRDAIPMNIYFEEGIQQIKHSPPLEIHLSSGTTASYHGIHTFVDFNGIGGTINSHTSQHIFRGENGSLSIEAETMEANISPLSSNLINASGQTNIQANEVFKFAVIGSNLSGKGYTLQAGKTYYFSLRKTWNITSGGITYSITRTCEPIPVLWPLIVI